MAKKKRYIANNTDTLKDFYKLYDPSYWKRKVIFLKEAYDNADKVLGFYKNELDTDILDQKADFKKGIAIDVHFLGYQMIENLFELIFAVLQNDNRQLWHALSQSNWRKNNKYIEKLGKGDFSVLQLDKKRVADINGEKVEIDPFRWVFYFRGFEIDDDYDWDKNINNIKKIIRYLAKEFSDREHYNAYKHGLRLYNSSFQLGIGAGDNPSSFSVLGSSDNSINYLTYKLVEKNKKEEIYHAQRTSKPIDIERDTNICMLVYEMIFDIIESRKPYMNEKPNQKDRISLYHFDEVDMKTLHPNVGTYEFSIGI